jgi:hypothetical protein
MASVNVSAEPPSITGGLSQKPVRRSKRVPMAYPVFYAGIALQGQGMSLNLSTQGCQVHGTVPVKKGTALTLSMMHPEQSFPVIIDRARVIWSKGRRFGLRLDVIYPSEREQLGKLLALSAQESDPQTRQD